MKKDYVSIDDIYIFFWTVATNTCSIALKLGTHVVVTIAIICTKCQGDRTSIRRCRPKKKCIIGRHIEAILH